MLSVIMLSVIMLSVVMLGVVMECRYAECRYARCRYVGYRYPECRGTLLLAPRLFIETTFHFVYIYERSVCRFGFSQLTSV
jgi:hypothetical protein